MTYSPHLLGLIVSIGLVACNGDTTPRSAAPASPARASAPLAAAPSASSPVRHAPVLVTEARQAPERDDEAPLDPAGALDEQERWLLEADDATLTREQRVARAHAQRKLVMADPDSPLRTILEQMDEQVESGEYADMARDMYAGRTPFPGRG